MSSADDDAGIDRPTGIIKPGGVEKERRLGRIARLCSLFTDDGIASPRHVVGAGYLRTAVQRGGGHEAAGADLSPVGKDAQSRPTFVGGRSHGRCHRESRRR